MEKCIFLHKPVKDTQQAHKVEECPDNDACCFQKCPHLEKNTKSEACIDAVLCIEITKNAEQISWQTMEEIKHEDYQCNILQSPSQIE